MVFQDNLLHPPSGGHPLSHPNTIIASFLVCWASYLVMQWTGFTLPHKSLKRKDQVEWHSRVISSVHALVLCLGETPLPDAMTKQASIKARGVHAVCDDSQ